MFEGALNSHTVRVYDLQVSSCVRLDTTTSSGYRPVEAEGLFQFGHSKDYRPRPTASEDIASSPRPVRATR